MLVLVMIAPLSAVYFLNSLKNDDLRNQSERKNANTNYKILQNFKSLKAKTGS